MSKDNGGPAFPIYPRIEGGKSTSIADAVGMTLRDYFAAKAMAAIWGGDALKHLHEVAKKHKQNPDESIANAAYAQADAMIAERSK